MNVKIILVCVSLMLTACASNQLSDFADISAVEEGYINSPLKISARFNSFKCSDYFAYLDFSVENPSSKWRTLANLKINFPYQSNNLFEVVEGERLALWQEGEVNRKKLDVHNGAMASLAVAGLGLGLMATDNDVAEVAGSALYAGTAIAGASKGIGRNINRVETSSGKLSNYLIGHNLEIPPGMTRKFWVVVSAQEKAPLMASIGGEFDDENGVLQAFKMPLDGWQNCQWQKNRKEFLREAVMPKNRFFYSSSTQHKSLEPEMSQLIKKEHELQQAKLASSNR